MQWGCAAPSQHHQTELHYMQRSFWLELQSLSKCSTSACSLPGQYASTSSFCAEESVGEPSSDSGMRGLSTNFAFLRGAKEKEGERERGLMNKGNSEQQMEALNDTVRLRSGYPPTPPFFFSFLLKKKKKKALSAFFTKEMALIQTCRLQPSEYAGLQQLLMLPSTSLFPSHFNPSFIGSKQDCTLPCKGLRWHRGMQSLLGFQVSNSKTLK